MKQIPKRDAMRILSHINKAKAIFEKAESESDNGTIGMKGEQIDDIHMAIGSLEYYVNNTIWS